MVCEKLARLTAQCQRAARSAALILSLAAFAVAQEAAPAAAPDKVPVVRIENLQTWKQLLDRMESADLKYALFDPTQEGIDALMKHREALVASHCIRAYSIREYKGYGVLMLEFMGDHERLLRLANDPQSVPGDDPVLQLAQGIIDGCITPDMTPAQKAAALHDAVVKLCTYNDEAAAVAARQDAEAALKEPHCTTCEGYSMAYLLLCRMVGIPCLWVGGAAQPSGQEWQPHGWNLIQLDGKWYHVDTCFDDPRLPDGASTCERSYFGKTDAEMEANHRWDREVYPPGAEKAIAE